MGQIAVVLVLLASAGLLLESFRRLLGQEGYEAGSVVAMDLAVSGSFDTNGDQCRMYRALRDRLAALPSGSSASYRIRSRSGPMNSASGSPWAPVPGA